MVKNVQANFEIESNKKELVKAIANRKGMTFKEFVNYAIDIAIKGETKEKAYLLQDKEVLENELKELEEKYNNDKKQIEDNYNNNKTTIEEKYNNDKSKIEDRIKEIEITLENMSIEYEEKSEKDNYNKIFNIVYSGTKIDDVEDLIMDHATKYNCDADELKKKIQKEVTNKRYS